MVTIIAVLFFYWGSAAGMFIADLNPRIFWHSSLRLSALGESHSPVATNTRA